MPRDAMLQYGRATTSFGLMAEASVIQTRELVMASGLRLFIIVIASVLTGCLDSPRAPYVDVHDLVTHFDDSRSLAEEGSAHGQYRLGVQYESLGRNYREAVRWYRMAALQRHPDAMYRLCMLSDQGRGLLHDYQEAMRWCRLAADHGPPQAMLMLGVYFEQGLGIAADRIHAHQWYNLAAANGLEEGVRRRDRLTREMTAQQLAQAHVQARNWKPQYQDTDP